MDVTVLSVIESVKSGSYSGGVTVGTLENGGVGIAPYHDLSSEVSSELASEVEALRKGIISGSIVMNKYFKKLGRNKSVKLKLHEISKSFGPVKANSILI